MSDFLHNQRAISRTVAARISAYAVFAFSFSFAAAIVFGFFG